MALLDDLIAKVADEDLRGELAAAVDRFKKTRQFGLVFEEHIPETSSLLGYPVQVGALVEVRTEPSSTDLYRVEQLTPKGRRATIVRAAQPDEDAWTVDTDDLMVVKPFGEPIYPALQPAGAIERAHDTPSHAVIDGENFHALQLLVYLYQGQVDCIYADPPYNTGARDWKYNNRYVDANDSWRHSKWLSMMERRLKLAKKLLRPNSGVLIVTIDEHEVNHLGVLLEQIFPEYLRYMVTSVINPKGTFKQNFGRVDEQLFFVVPNVDGDVVVPRPRATEDQAVDDTADRLIRKLAAASQASVDDLLSSETLEPDEHELLLQATEDVAPDAEEEAEPLGEDESPPEPDAEYDYWFLRRRGQESSYRTQRPNSFYAILVNEKAGEVVGIGPHLERDDPWHLERDGDVVTVFPVDNEGHERVWRYSRETMQGYIDAGEIVVGRFNRTTKTWTLNHRKLKKDVLRHKTVWWYKSHDAGVHGTNVVNRLLGVRNLFPFPKSIYAVRDALATVVRDRPDALILDFFAGSGTTVHSTCMLNLEDGGHRRCIAVTNNEVDDREANRLHREGIFRGDPEFEARGIFEQVTRPRISAAISGTRADGTVVPGSYIDGRSFADGFDANVEFFRLQYLDPDSIDLGRQFEAILPGLWLAAGGLGSRESAKPNAHYLLPEGSSYGVLFSESRFRQFRNALGERPDLTHVWLVTDSEEAFAEMAAALPGHLRVSMLYRDYLRNFRINVDHST